MELRVQVENEKTDYHTGYIQKERKADVEKSLYENRALRARLTLFLCHTCRARRRGVQESFLEVMGYSGLQVGFNGVVGDTEGQGSRKICTAQNHLLQNAEKKDELDMS